MNHTNVLNLKILIKQLIQYTTIFLLLFSPSLILASGTREVKGIRYWSSPDYTRVVIDLSSTAEFLNHRLSNPERLCFDLRDTILPNETQKHISVGDGILKTIRTGQFKPDIARIVLDLDDIVDFNAFILDEPARFVVDVYGKQKIQKQRSETVKRRIVIDPGHGGHDPGAIGFKGLYEKNVVLDIALKLKKILSSDPYNEIILTRETDIFLPLEERTAIANKKNADFFISIHANASKRRAAKGIETFLLNWTDNEEAIRVAARENAISFKKMKAMHKQMDVLDIIKSDLIRQNKRDESIKLAHYIQNSMVSNLSDTYKNTQDLGVKQALFYVLFGASMPSVLVEVSFISNPEEENLLSQESYRMDIAQAIAKGLDKYINTIPPIQKIAELRFNDLHFR